MMVNQAMFPLATMCKTFGVSRAGYYAWMKASGWGASVSSD